ncbi:MAG: TRAP transporter small permease [Gammaproteobacteria bacterium]|nr:TRAP transporter small permease [Gammaproteobacteria bacterium]NNL99805.1 TRAP transporter small permease [Gammaproteobacteria bacterium]
MAPPEPPPAGPARFLARLTRCEEVFTAAAFAIIVVTMFADVLSRELTGVGLHWARQVGVYANIIVVMLGFGLASQSGSHLRPRIADALLPARWDGAIDRLQDGVMAAVCLFFAVLAAQITVESLHLDERSILLGVVVWPIMAVLPLAFAIATVRHGLFALYPALRPEPHAAGIANAGTIKPAATTGDDTP